MPATCVPWNDESGSTASRPAAPAFGPGNTRATITFGVVHFVEPRGKPGGYEKPARIEERVRLVDAVVDDGDLHPGAVGAALLLGARRRRSRRASGRRRACTRRSGRPRRSSAAGRARAASRPGSDTVSPSSTTWKRRPTRASGIARRSSAVSCCCACTTRRRYARELAVSTLETPAGSGRAEPSAGVLRERRQREPRDHANPARGARAREARPRGRAGCERSPKLRWTGSELRRGRQRGDERRAAGEKRNDAAQGSGG